MMNPFFGLTNLFEQYRQMQTDYENTNMSDRYVPQNQATFGQFIESQMGNKMEDPTEKFTFFDRLKNTANQAGSAVKDAAGSVSRQDLAKGINAIPGIVSAGQAAFGKAQFDDSVEAPGVVTDVYGQPVYNQERFINSNEAFRDDIKGTVGKGVLQGGLGGLQAGASLGGLPGAAIGLVGGALGGLFGGKKRKKSLLREAVRREGSALKGVERFNTASERFRGDVEADDFRSAIINRRNNF
jgi:hypothetical protein